MIAGPVISPAAWSWSKMSGHAQQPVEADRREQQAQPRAGPTPTTSTRSPPERPSSGDVAGGDERRGERQQRERQRGVDVVRHVAHVGEHRQQRDHDDDEHVEREHPVQRVRRAQQQPRRRPTSSSVAQPNAMSMHDVGHRSAPHARAPLLRARRWRARTASGSPASIRCDDQDVALLVDVDGDLVGRLAGEHAPQRDVVRASGRRAGSRRTRAAPRAGEAEPRRAPAAADHLDRRLASTRPAATSAAGGGVRPAAAAPRPQRDGERRARAQPAADVARRSWSSPAGRRRRGAAPQEHARHPRRPREHRGGVAAEREQRLRPQPSGQHDEREHGDDGLLGPAAARPGPLPAPEVVLVDLEHVDERQRAAEEEQRDQRRVRRPPRGTARACRRTRRRAGRRRRSARR